MADPLDIAALRRDLSLAEQAAGFMLTGGKVPGKVWANLTDCRAALDELEAARAEVERLREAVDLYGDHQPGRN